MPRPTPPSPVRVERFPLKPEDRERLASHLGREELPALCADQLGDILARHLEAHRAEGNRQDKTTPGNVAVAIGRVCRALEKLVALDSGIDVDTRRSLKPAADAFIFEAQARIAELQNMPRIYPRREILRLTGPYLRLIFKEHVQVGFDERRNLRWFALYALWAAGVDTRSIDEAHLDRLDEYLDAEPPSVDVPNLVG